MITLTIRTDKPEAEIGLFDDEEQIAYLPWQAHRQLAESIHIKSKELLDSQKYQLSDLNGIVVFHGPGSFTGLRIGVSVANALSDGLGIPVVAAAGEGWIRHGIKRLQARENDRIVQPEYGAPPHVTTPRR